MCYGGQKAKVLEGCKLTQTLLYVKFLFDFFKLCVFIFVCVAMLDMHVVILVLLTFLSDLLFWSGTCGTLSCYQIDICCGFCLQL